MKTFVFSIYGGAGKSVLAKALANTANIEYVSIDPQDGGCSDNVKANAIIDCPPYLEAVLPLFSNGDHVIYPLSKDPINSFHDQIMLLKDTFSKLFDAYPNLKITLVISDLKSKWSPQEHSNLLLISNEQVSACQSHLCIKKVNKSIVLGNLNLLSEISI